MDMDDRAPLRVDTSKLHYPPSSSPPPSAKKEVHQVTSKAAKEYQPSFFRRIFMSGLNEDVKSIKSYLIDDVLLPNIREGLYDMMTGSVDMLFGREPRRRSSPKVPSTTGSSFRYENCYVSSKRPEERRSSRNVKDIFFEDNGTNSARAEASDVLDSMQDILDKFGEVTVLDLYSLCGIKSTSTDDSWGWKNLRDARIEKVRDGYVLSMPRPVAL